MMFSGFNQSIRRMPDEPAALGILQHLDKDQLQKYLEDDEALDQLIRDLPQTKGLQDEKEACLTTNKSLAEYNLSKEVVLAEKKAHLAATYTRAKTAYDNYQVKVDKLNETGGGQMTVDTALALLRTETEKSEQTAEEAADGYLHGNLETEEFLINFIQLSTKAHSQKIKTEKLQEIATRLRHGLPPQTNSRTVTPNPAAAPAAPKTNFYAGTASQWGNAPYTPGTGSTPYF